jgi:hypothetical protein
MPSLNGYLSQKYSLSGKKDSAFLESVYSLMRSEFQYKPVLTRQQFFSKGFSERKCMFVSDVIDLVLKLEGSLNKTRKAPVDDNLHITNSVVNNPPSRFISEAAWYNHLSRSIPAILEEPNRSYPIPQGPPLVDDCIEDSILVDFAGYSSDSNGLLLQENTPKVSATHTPELLNARPFDPDQYCTPVPANCGSTISKSPHNQQPSHTDSNVMLPIIKNIDSGSPTSKSPQNQQPSHIDSNVILSMIKNIESRIDLSVMARIEQLESAVIDRDAKLSHTTRQLELLQLDFIALKDTFEMQKSDPIPIPKHTSQPKKVALL